MVNVRQAVGLTAAAKPGTVATELLAAVAVAAAGATGTPALFAGDAASGVSALGFTLAGGAPKTGGFP